MKKIFQSLAIVVTGIFLSHSSSEDTFCPTCGLMNSNLASMPFYNTMGFSSMPSFFPSGIPWWSPYGAMTYSNFYFPGAWMGAGMNGGMYPGGGHVGMGKPNIYLAGKPGTRVKVRVNLNQESNWLMSVPVHGKEGWEVVLQEDGQLQTKNHSKYNFLFYDFRLDEKYLQDSQGFCTEREGLIERLAGILKERGFHPNEISDFATYWEAKLPAFKNFCVFPQTEKDLESVADLHIDPKPNRLTRMAFVLVPEEARSSGFKGKKFLNKPSSKWTAPQPENEKSDAKEASLDEKAKPGLEVREWGIGFLMSNP